jgi:putative colanic acid biosynthesis acetyltransferase WcaF
MRDPAIPLAIDPAANRAARKYTRVEMLRRVLWGFGQWLIRLSPRPCFGWRRLVLRLFGASVGQQVRIYASTHLYMPWNVELGDWAALGENVLIYSLGKVRIGPKVTVSYRAHVCAGAHDLNDPALPLIKPPVFIDEGAWIGTDAFVGPGVTVGRGAVIGARAVAVKDIEPFAIVAGNPARIVGKRVLR